MHWIYDYKIGRDKDYQVRLSSLNLRTYTESYEETQQYVVDDTPATYRQSLGSRKGNKDEERQMLLWLAQQRASKLLLQQKLESSKSANTDGFDSEGVKTEGSGCPWNPEQEPLEAIALHFEMQMKRRYSRRRQMNKEIDPKVDVIPTTAIRVLADSAEPMAHDFAWRFHFKNAKSCLILNPSKLLRAKFVISLCNSTNFLKKVGRFLSDLCFRQCGAPTQRKKFP